MATTTPPDGLAEPSSGLGAWATTMTVTAGGLLLGVLTNLAQGWLPGSWNQLANSGAVWSAVAFAGGAPARRAGHGAPGRGRRPVRGGRTCRGVLRLRRVRARWHGRSALPAPLARHGMRGGAAVRRRSVLVATRQGRTGPHRRPCRVHRTLQDGGGHGRLEPPLRTTSLDQLRGIRRPRPPAHGPHPPGARPHPDGRRARALLAYAIVELPSGRSPPEGVPTRQPKPLRREGCLGRTGSVR